MCRLDLHRLDYILVECFHTTKFHASKGLELGVSHVDWSWLHACITCIESLFFYTIQVALNWLVNVVSIFLIILTGHLFK